MGAQSSVSDRVQPIGLHARGMVRPEVRIIARRSAIQPREGCGAASSAKSRDDRNCPVVRAGDQSSESQTSPCFVLLFFVSMKPRGEGNQTNCKRATFVTETETHIFRFIALPPADFISHSRFVS